MQYSLQTNEVSSPCGLIMYNVAYSGHSGLLVENLKKNMTNMELTQTRKLISEVHVKKKYKSLIEQKHHSIFSIFKVTIVIRFS